jgi:AcrR family transcriptional regulator
VVDAVLLAAVEELARTGFSGLSMEAVADRAKVNKTTVYRRWPTRNALVRAAIVESTQRVFEHTDTGTIRGDLIEMLHGVRGTLDSPLGRGVAVALMADDPRIRQLARLTRKEGANASFAVLERGVSRGELPTSINRQLILDLLFGPLEQKLVIEGESVDDAWCETLVDFVLAGAQVVTKRSR